MIEILIADDHPVIREGIRSILKNQPDIFIKKEVDNGLDVLEELEKEKYDILVLDISLSKKNGLEVLEEINKRNYGIKVIILSIHTEREYIVRSFELGAFGYLTKETVGNELIKAIRNVYMGKKYVPLHIAEELANFFEYKNYPERKLSNREYQVLIMIASGKSIKEIADNLDLSEKTVSTYRNRILKKLNLKNNAEIIYYSVKNKLINI
jgi:two-component system invasion response regulator UvrY